MKSLRIFTTLVFLALPLLWTEAEAQCVMCRAVAETNYQTEVNDIGEGLNQGILYLMSVPYVIIASLGIYIYRKRRASSTTESDS